MEYNVVGEISNLKLKQITIEKLTSINLFFREKSSDEIFIYNETLELNIYKYDSEVYLIGGTIWNYNNGIDSINKFAEFLMKENLFFEIEIDGKSIYRVKK